MAVHKRLTLPVAFARRERYLAFRCAITGDITPLSQYEKLIAAIANNPRDVRFEDACKVAEWLGFSSKGGAGSHYAFSKSGEPTGLNFQNGRNGKIPAYQARQLLEMIRKYGEE